MFFQDFLHIGVVKLFSHIRSQIFRTSSIRSNYLSDNISRFASILALERNGPRVFAQHIGEYVEASVENRVRAHLNDISLSQIVSSSYDAFANNFF